MKPLSEIKSLLELHKKKVCSLLEYSIGDIIQVKDTDEPPTLGWDSATNPAWEAIPSLLTATIVGGSRFEDPGDGQESNIAIEVEGNLYVIPGYYSSWDSSQLDISDMYEADRVEVVKVEFHPKKK
jgi:hypothetical protein